MSQRIKSLAESPCYQCGKMEQCAAKVKRSPVLGDIVDCVMPRADFDYHGCSIYKAIILEENENNA
nr:MAG TPA: hypothetical protein [Caudoviricetes sp.]